MDPLRYTYDAEADAAYLYLIGEIGTGEAVRSRLVPLELHGASVMVDFDADGHAVGIEFLGVTNLFRPDTVDALERGRFPFGT